MVSAVCSMSTRAKSRPADFISDKIAGLRTMVSQVPICGSPRSRPARIELHMHPSQLPSRRDAAGGQPPSMTSSDPVTWLD